MTASERIREARKNGARCPHKPSRLSVWTATDGVLVVCCSDCGAVLKGAA